MSAAGRYPSEVCQNLIIPPAKTHYFAKGGDDYEVPSDSVAVMMEVEDDGEVKFLAFDDSGDADARTLYRYKGVQYAGRLKKLYASSDVNVVLWITRINSSNVDDIDYTP